jgi:hypothetical protein
MGYLYKAFMVARVASIRERFCNEIVTELHFNETFDSQTALDGIKPADRMPSHCFGELSETPARYGGITVLR